MDGLKMMFFDLVIMGWVHVSSRGLSGWNGRWLVVEFNCVDGLGGIGECEVVTAGSGCVVSTQGGKIVVAPIDVVS